MGWEPITYCRECGDAFDVYRAPDERTCECCAEFLAERDATQRGSWIFEEQVDERAS